MIKTNNYYRIAQKASVENINHPGMISLFDLCSKAKKVLDVGCGEGSRLNILLPKKTGTGVDPSKYAIGQAMKKYPQHKFLIGSGEKIPFKNDSFDLVYSAFSLEHCRDPKQYINEMLRVCMATGHVVILAPNFGAPNRRSPVSLDNPLKKLLSNFVKDFFPSDSLGWKQVIPKSKYKSIDDDTTIEPYLLTLNKYLKTQRVEIVESSSLWELESKPDKIYKYLFYYLGKNNIFPFKYWGPQIFIHIIKI